MTPLSPIPQTQPTRQSAESARVRPARVYLVAQPTRSVLELQRVIGNRAVTRLIQPALVHTGANSGSVIQRLIV